MAGTVEHLQDNSLHLLMVEIADELRALLQSTEKYPWTYLEFIEALLSFELKWRIRKRSGKSG
ncbi:hypothetical protein [Peribacillus sp. SCS-155]